MRRRNIKIPSDFFDRERIVELKNFPNREELILLYFHLLTISAKHDYVFFIANIVLTDDILSTTFNYGDIGTNLKILEEKGLIKRYERKIEVFKAWMTSRDRSNPKYKVWRLAVFKRDGFKCQSCGNANDLQAHHIRHWKDDIPNRYNIDNGITLCRKCHLKAHGGSWR
nr:MAG TPA: NinG recombination protein [Caudoviricetes sp.]